MGLCPGDRDIAPGGLAYHVINRSAGRLELFQDDADYAAFERVLAQARKRFAMRICAYVLMPNHFHLVLWPELDGQVSRFMQWLSMTHTQRWHAHRHSVGRGHLYQSRFKSFPIEQDGHFLAVCRYVERNALRANLVARPQDWPWCSLRCRERRLKKSDELLDEWPVQRPRGWSGLISEPPDTTELADVRRSVLRGRPYGRAEWVLNTAQSLGLLSSLNPPGRPAVEAIRGEN